MSGADGRSWVAVDRYGFRDLAREYHLTEHEVVLVLRLLLASDFRSHEWAGSLTELADEPPTMSRNTVAKGLHRLVALGVLEEVVPLRHGARRFTVRLVAYDRLVAVKERTRREALAQTSATQTEALAQTSATQPDESRSTRANEHEFTDSDQHFRAVPVGMYRGERSELSGTDLLCPEDARLSNGSLGGNGPHGGRRQRGESQGGLGEAQPIGATLDDAAERSKGQPLESGARCSGDLAADDPAIYPLEGERNR